MGKIYTAMGLMSGTSLDGVDVSIIQSDGNREFSSIFDRYFQYNNQLVQKILNLREKITSSLELSKHYNEIKDLEREITLFHVQAIKETLENSKSLVDLIGFHGQTIFHDPEKKISKQLGDGKLLSQLTKKKIVYDFRQNDLENGGQGAPLTPIFHNVLANQINKKFNLGFPLNFLNIGGIANITSTTNWDSNEKIYACDIGPGNCLIDQWIRKNSEKKYDKDGSIAKLGKTNSVILNQALNNQQSLKTKNILSYDYKDFDLNFVRGLSLEDGTATLTEFTGSVLGEGILDFLNKLGTKSRKILVCGGGRKNLSLMETIKKKLTEKHTIENIDNHGIDGDFIESQAFAYLAIRSSLNLPISFPKTTGCKEPSTGGVLVENF